MLKITILMAAMYTPFVLALEISNVNGQGWCLSCDKYKYCLSNHFEARRMSIEGARFFSVQEANNTRLDIDYSDELPSIESITEGAFVLSGSKKIESSKVKKYVSNEETFKGLTYHSWVFRVEGCSAVITVNGSEEVEVEKEVRHLLEGRADK